MNKKGNEKQYQSSIALYQRLKNVLKAEKNNFIVTNQLVDNNRRKNESKAEKLESINLNDSIINSQGSGIGFSLINIVQKPSATFGIAMTPYQQRKQTQKVTNLKFLDGKKKRAPYYEIFKGKNHHLLTVKESRQKRLNNFFSSKQQNKQQNQNIEENLAFSLILNKLNQQIQLQKISISQKPINKTQNLSLKYQRFFNNSQIHKNMQSIQTIKKKLLTSQQKNSKMIKHFPQFQILNQNYFTQSKKNLFKRINCHNAFGSFGRVKQSIITSKNMGKKNNQCKKFISQENQVEKERKYLEEKKKNFQYFVYEYKTVGDRESKLLEKTMSTASKYKLHCKRSSLQSATFLRSKPSFFHRQSSNSTKSANLSSNNIFHNFIYKNKQDIQSTNLKSPKNRQRSMTANIVPKQRQDLVNDRSRVYGDGWKSVDIKKKVRIGGDENFVKPWESSAQVEVGF